ncbi:MAG: glycosyltransferase [Acidobacteria bacterium]|nr:glycosyltransferase [Acidobacteriota bacterium]
MNPLLKKADSALKIWRSRGLTGIRNHLRRLRRNRREERNYRRWIELHRFTADDRRELEKQIAALARRPLISVVMPVYDVEEKWLRRCLETVFEQVYENWEFCIADDHSPSPHIKKVLREYAERDARVRVVFRETNGHISAASNSALALATGEFCVLLDHDDELAPDALLRVAETLVEFPETAFIYSDEDMIDERGQRYAPKFKPDFSRDLFYSLNLITHLSAYRTDILRAIGGFRAGVEGSQDYDLALRFIERIDERQIRHIPRILYHWRAIRGSVALSADEKPYAHERARQALREHFERTGTPATVERGIYQFHRVRYALPEPLPKASLILSGVDDAAATVDRFQTETAYENLEIILICANEPKNAALPDNVKTIARAGLSTAASLNEAAARATGELLCFLDAGLRPRSTDWLRELAGFALRPEIGAAGGKIVDRSETVLGAGLIIGFDDAVGIAHRRYTNDADGYFARLQVINNFSAVSARALAVRRALFDETGGFDAENLPAALFDADFCLKLREQDLRVVFTPYAEFVFEGKDVLTKPAPRAREFFKRRWRAVVERDPFYNPNLARRGETFTIEIGNRNTP